MLDMSLTILQFLDESKPEKNIHNSKTDNFFTPWYSC